MATPSFLGTRRNGYRSGSTCRSAHFGKLDVVINTPATLWSARLRRPARPTSARYLIRTTWYGPGLGRVKTFWLEDVRTSRVGDCYGALAYACIAATSGRRPMMQR